MHEPTFGTVHVRGILPWIIGYKGDDKHGRSVYQVGTFAGEINESPFNFMREFTCLNEAAAYVNKLALAAGY